MPELSHRNFCDGLEMKLPLSLIGILQAGAPETTVKIVTPCFTFSLCLQELRYKFVFHYRQLPHGA